MRRYRIVMNGHGQFKLQRKGWLLWSLEWSLGNGLYKEGWYRDAEYDPPAEIYDSSEQACEALLRAMKHDADEDRAQHWMTVVEDKADLR